MQVLRQTGSISKNRRHLLRSTWIARHSANRKGRASGETQKSEISLCDGYSADEEQSVSPDEPIEIPVTKRMVFKFGKPQKKQFVFIED